MPTDGGDRLDDGRAIDAALAEALEDLPGGNRADGLEAIDSRWLSVGMRLGLERPERARTLLAMIEAREATQGSLEDDGDSAAGADPTQGTRSIPVSSALLARAAALSASARTTAGPEVVFGWAARLAPDEISRLGLVVGDMLAAGSPSDIGRGFGITWTDGVRVPRPELETMLEEFAELEITVGGILAGRDLRTGEPVPKPQGIAAWLGDWKPRTRPEESRAAEAIDRSGEAARRGLVALWNVWMAMRYRTLIPPPTFDLLVHPWLAVIGPLPE